MDFGIIPEGQGPFAWSPEPIARIGPPTSTLGPETPIDRHAAVSLVVPTFFNGELKAGVLGLLLDGIGRSDAIREIILIDAGDTLGGVEGLRRLVGGKELTVLACEPGRRARARNLGAARAACELLMFLDDDMILRDWRLADVLVSGMLAGGFDCALFPRRQYARFPLLYRAEALGQFIARWRRGGDSFDDPALIDPARDGSSRASLAFCFPGCFTLIRREAFARIGGFPDDYRGWGFEDAAFAIRAADTLRTWNLFRRCPPLLHVDHPVSPYKSEEYHENLRTFRSTHSSLDFDRLCRETLAGEDFTPRGVPAEGPAVSFEPLRAAVSGLGLWPGEELASNHATFAALRAEAGRDPAPGWIVLHGSRADGTAGSDSDVDLLALFRGGSSSEFYVGEGEGDGPRLEVEFAESGKYEYIASRPAFHTLFGPIELAKVAKGVVLWGDVAAWDSWVDLVLRTALRHGRALWLLFAAALEMHPGKLGPMRCLFVASLRAVLARADAEAYRDDLVVLDRPGPGHLLAHARDVLDREVPGWRQDTAAGRRVFAQQVPPLWVALRRALHEIG